MKRILALSFLLCLPFCILAYADLSKGAKGPAVEELQQVLINQGYLDDAADGIYGDKTEAAVSAFQKSNGLQENGIVDGETQTAIYRQEKNRLERVVLSNGSTGYDVIQLQVRLIELGYLSGTASGVFDDECEVALIQFQAENGLNTTGVADKAVRDLLFPSSVSESGNSLFKEVAKITANWDWSMIGIVATVVGSLVAIINLSYSFTETARKRRQARYYIRNNAATAKRAMSTPVFPCSTINEGRIIIPYVKDFLYSKIQIHCANDGKKYAPSKLRDSFMLNGDSGCGKTAVMRERFKNTERWSKIIRSIGVLYYERSIITVPIIDSNERQLLLQSIRDASFSRLYLYIDGADEQITEAQLENLREFINLVSTHTKKIILRISTRSYFRAAITVELGPYLQRQYSIDKWKKNELKGFINEVLKRLRKKTKQDYSRIRTSFKKVLNYQDLSYSPLVCKLLIYNMIVDTTYRLNKNTFEIYRSFINNVLSYSMSPNPFASDQDVIRFAADVYKRYYQGELVCYLSNNAMLSSILKKAGNGKYTFIHQSFYEFFVAMHLSHCIRTITEETAKVFTIDYSNSFADFISEALKCIDSSIITNTLVSLYGYTLTGQASKGYLARFHSSKQSSIQKYINKLSKEQFITLKFMIANRMGRLKTPDAIVNEFLSYVYERDDHVAQKWILLTDGELNYYRAILKRCCAISASFIGLHEIEMDYIRKITGIPDASEYNQYYDVANRSHTLLYYGDYTVSKDDELMFRDAPEKSSCKACRKRLNHLQELFDCSDVKLMNNKQLRWYRFRLFDIATIYCFAKNRRDHHMNPKKSMGLTDDDCQLLKRFRVRFDNDDAERAALIEEIRIRTMKILE